MFNTRRAKYEPYGCFKKLEDLKKLKDLKNLKINPNVVNSNLTISNNVLIYKNSLVQISNISKITVSPAPPMRYPIWAFVCIVVGLMIMSYHLNQYSPKIISILFGAGVCAVGGYTVYTIYNSNKNPGDNLNLHLNSGSVVSFYCSDEEFLQSVLETIQMEIQENRNSSVTFDFNNAKIINSNVLNDSKVSNG